MSLSIALLAGIAAGAIAKGRKQNERFSVNSSQQLKCLNASGYRYTIYSR
ncbi:hypothetical protein [Almyronema epifaneia]|uniref:Uncharacterized protein n=1 Tax=Almyronema epifaneia S1 TaxID=2991925 RepID=A0ABW6IIF8_9CYAN